MAMKKFLPVLALILTACMLSSCAITKRLDRVDAHRAFDRKKSMDESTVNLWPLLVANKDYTSVLWPFMDFDKHGFAIRPLINKEKDDWSFLWPLLAWNPEDKDGWCALGYWNAKEGYFGVVPLFHYDPRGEFGYMSPLCWWVDGNLLCIPLGAYVKDYGCVTFLYSHLMNKNAGTREYISYEHNSMLPEGDRWDESNRWDFYGSLLFYLLRKQGYILDSKSPDFKKEYLLALESGYNSLKQDLYRRDTGKTAKDPEVLRKHLLDKLSPAVRQGTNSSFGVFPLFHANTLDGNCKQWHALFYLLASGRSTPDDSYFFAPALLTYWKREQQKNQRKEFLFTPLFYRSSEQSYELKKELNPGKWVHRQRALEERVLLNDPIAIKDWEKPYQYDACLVKTMPKTAEEAQKMLDLLNNRENYEQVYRKSGWGVPLFYMHDAKQWENSSEEKTSALCWLYRQKNKSSGYKEISLGFDLLAKYENGPENERKSFSLGAGALAYFKKFPEGHDWHIPLFWRDYLFRYGDSERIKKRCLNWFYEQYTAKKFTDGKPALTLNQERALFPFFLYDTHKQTAPGGNEYELKRMGMSVLLGMYFYDWEKHQNRTMSGLLYTLLSYKREKHGDAPNAKDPDPPWTLYNSPAGAASSDANACGNSFEYNQHDILHTGKATAKIVFWKKGTPDEATLLFNHYLRLNLAAEDKDFLKKCKEYMAKLKMPAADLTKPEVRKQLRQELYKKYTVVQDWTRYRLLGLLGRYAVCGDASNFELGGGALMSYAADGDEEKEWDLLPWGMLMNYEQWSKDRYRFKMGWGLLADHRREDASRTETDVLCGLLYDGERKTCPDVETAQKEGNSILRNTEKMLSTSYADDYMFDYSRDRFLLLIQRASGQVLCWKPDTPEAARELYDGINSWNEHSEKERQKIVNAMQKLGMSVPAKLPKQELTEQEVDQIRAELALKYSEPKDYAENGMSKLAFYRVACGEDSKFWLGAGILAKGEYVKGHRETSVLWYLYRSTVTPESSSRLIFPFIKTYSSRKKSSFSFLWRFINIEVTEKGVGGHILFIPF